MAFDEIRLPEQISPGFISGPEFMVNVVRTKSGFEQRVLTSSTPLKVFDIAYGPRSQADIDALIAFFNARNGPLRGFRFKDFADFEIETQVNFGTGDGATTAFQLRRRYTDSGSFTFDKNIYKTVSGTVKIYDNGILQTETTHYTIDHNTGVVTFVAAPANTNPLTWTGEYDTPVRFTNKKIDFNMQQVAGDDTIGVVTSIGLQEIRIASFI